MPLADFTTTNAALLVGFRYPETLRRVDLRFIYPPMRERFVRVLGRCTARGVFYWGEFGFRAYSFQAQLHAAFNAAQEGLAAAQRTGNLAAIAAAQKVAQEHGRAAPPGLSGHQYGLCLDVTHDADPAAPGLQPDWVPSNYTVWGEELAREGLDWGRRYGDLPHGGDPRFVDGGQLAVLRAKWLALPETMPEGEKLLRVWAFLDTLPPLPNPA